MTDLTLVQTIKELKDKKFSLEELNKAYLVRIKKLNPALNAYLSINEKCQKIPAAIKDVICTRDIVTTASSKILENFVPPYDATVIKMLDTRGVGVVGKTNHDE